MRFPTLSEVTAVHVKAGTDYFQLHLTISSKPDKTLSLFINV